MAGSGDKYDITIITSAFTNKKKKKKKYLQQFDYINKYILAVKGKINSIDKCHRLNYKQHQSM